MEHNIRGLQRNKLTAVAILNNYNGPVWCRYPSISAASVFLAGFTIPGLLLGTGLLGVIVAVAQQQA